MQLQELNRRFDETNTTLLVCLACLCPYESFAAFDKQKLIRLANFYPEDFSNVELVALEVQLGNYFDDVSTSEDFSKLKEIDTLYSLLRLTLLLPVATATVERAFSAMNILKNRLRNRMGDQ